MNVALVFGDLEFNFISLVFETGFNRWRFINLLSTESLSSMGLNQANLLFFEIIDGVVVLQELGTKHPVLFTLLATEACEVPWGHEQPGNVSALSSHVRVSWHVEVFCLTLSILDEVEMEVWKLLVLFLSASTRP